MAIGRSPNYPRITLEEALQKISEVYEKQHTYKTDKEVVAKNLGYGGINGGSQAMMGALGSYGLLLKEGKEFKVSDNAVSIIELAKDSSERTELIKSIANSPDIFADLHSEYKEKLPQIETLRHFLIKKKFLPKAASEVIRIYRANVEFVNQIDSEYNRNLDNDDLASNKGSKMQGQVAQLQGQNQQMPPPLKDGSQVIVDISSTGQINVTFSGSVNEQTFEILNGIREIEQKVKIKQNQRNNSEENNDK